MQIVGDELSRLALAKQGDFQDFDLLSRSAFNRYYYASFLVTRDTLGKMQSNWKGTAHAEIPKLLENGLKKPVRHQLNIQLTKGIIDKGDHSRLLTSINSVACELAQLLRSAYDARIVADYEPDIKITFDNKLIMLKTYKITTAKEWPTRAEMYCGRLLRLWKEIGLA